MIKLINDNCIEALKLMPSNSVDSIVTDPPYELGFMGKAWDSTGIANDVSMWREALRVLKPGGHLIAFSGTRTYHRMACAIEDAGFEIRDQMQWLYGSGFPKSMDISKAIDKAAGAVREKKIYDASEVGNFKGRSDTRPWIEKAKKQGYYEVDGDVPVTAAAAVWNGWGTALKPANEPIVVARKPLSEKTVAANVLRWGTGGINIDDSRIGTETIVSLPSRNKDCTIYAQDKWTKSQPIGERTEHIGRFPANVLLDETAAAILDEQSGITKSSDAPRNNQHKQANCYGRFSPQVSTAVYGDSGGASRFFYCAKASKRERGEGNDHATVKPLKLMEYLVTLVTPPNGTVLDPFMGS